MNEDWSTRGQVGTKSEPNSLLWPFNKILRDFGSEVSPEVGKSQEFMRQQNENITLITALVSIISIWVLPHQYSCTKFTIVKPNLSCTHTQTDRHTQTCTHSLTIRRNQSDCIYVTRGSASTLQANYGAALSWLSGLVISKTVCKLLHIPTVTPVVQQHLLYHVVQYTK